MKNLVAAAEMLEEVGKLLDSTKDYEQWARLNSVIKMLKRPVPKVFNSNESSKPDQKYFQYFLKTTWDARLYENMPYWNAGYCYELEDGRVQIWCGPPPFNTVYEYESMKDTHDWMLD